MLPFLKGNFPKNSKNLNRVNVAATFLGEVPIHANEKQGPSYHGWLFDVEYGLPTWQDLESLWKQDPGHILEGVFTFW